MYYPIIGLSRVIPAAYEFPIEDNNIKEEAVKIAKKEVGEKNVNYYETSIIQVTSSSTMLPYEYSVKENNCFDLISKSDYLKLMNLQRKNINLKSFSEDECILVKYLFDKEHKDIGNKYSLNITPKKTIDVTVIKTTLKNPIGFANSIGILVISDSLYNKLLKEKLQIKKIMSIDGKYLRNNEKVYKSLAPLFKDNIKFASAFQRKMEYIHSNSSTLLVITFITIIFFIATGSTLYFHNISAMMYDESEFNILKKMGYSNKKIKQISNKQIAVLFCIPYFLGLINSIFAINCYRFALMQDLLGKSSVYILPILFSVAIFTFIYIIYYIVTKYMCHRIILKNSI